MLESDKESSLVPSICQSCVVENWCPNGGRGPDVLRPAGLIIALSLFIHTATIQGGADAPGLPSAAARQKTLL